MNKTKIEWVKNPDGTQGYTWNPITGCLNGCDYCYARKLANGRLRLRYLANHNIIEPYIDDKGWKHSPTIATDFSPFYPRFWEDRLEPIGLTGGNKRPHSYGYLGGFKEHKPKGIFVCDMSDLFGIGIPQEWTQKVMDTIKKCPDHRFYLLTKQPQNLVKFSPFPPNCWVGVSVTTPELWQKAILYLHNIKASIKYLSLEPCLFVPHDIEFVLKYQTKGDGRIADQVIIGAQTKPYKPPKIEWVEEIAKACDQAGIPVFIKHNMNSENLPNNAFNKEGLVRQEMPEAK